SVLFPPRPDARPTIYAYSDNSSALAGLLKVGFTTSDAKTRVAQQYPIRRPGALPYTIVLEASAMRADGSSFTDRDVHRALKGAGIENPDGEWFRCTKAQVEAAIHAVRDRAQFELFRSAAFGLRPEQEAAVIKTKAYFESFRRDRANRG